MKHLFFALLYFFATVATSILTLKDIKRIMNASFKTKLIRK